MMRKMLSAILVFGLISTTLLVGNVRSGEGLEKDDVKDLVYGNVYYSADGLAKIFDNDTWVCENITAYCIDEYENGIVDLAIGNETNDLGESHVSGGYDYFRFDPYDKGWSNYSLNEEHIAVGETTVDGEDYVFITTFIYKTMDGNRRGFCEWAEWEPVPTPIVYAKGDTWINISIPKFTNPVLGAGTSNANNTIGFKVYKDGGPVGNTVSEGTSHYFFNDTESSSACNYSVSPILKGNYTTYGRSVSLSSDESALAPLNVVIESPNGDEYWAGGSEQNIKYSITGGLAPYTVTLKYSTDAGDTYPNTINTTVKQVEGECTYTWTLPETNPNVVKVKIEVTDDAFVSKNDASNNTFVIDSTAPTIKGTIPSADDSISIKKSVTVVFSEPMNQTATASSFEISPNPGGWVWTWNDAGDTMTGAHNNFVFDETYTATITTAAKDLAGNYLANDYLWNFTVSMVVCLNSPVLGDIWTGESTHDIEYEISGGVAPYTVTINYATDGENYNLINTTTKDAEGTYSYSWVLPATDSKTVNMKIIIVDGNETESVDTSGNFEIDSTAPTIVDYSGSAGVMLTTESVKVIFSEEMNQASAESVFSLKGADDVDVNGTFSWDGKTMSFVPDEVLTSNMDYTATINATAKDKSDPGNSLNQTYSWTFKAVQGRGDLILSLSISPSPEKGKTSTVTVTVSNTGPEADNLSGFLTVKFYESPDGETWTLVCTKYIQNIRAGNSSSASTTFTFDDYGKYYFLVEATSNNPTDTFPSGEKAGRASAYVDIPKPSEEIGLGPYTLIALMVVIIVILGALILLSLKKKGELTLKEKKEEKKEEESKEEETKKESEEEEGEE